MKTKFHSALFLLTAFAARPAFATSPVEWSNTVASGNGCTGDSAVVTMTPDGSELSWTSNEYNFELQGNPASKAVFCRLSASAKVAKGYYLESLTQKATFGAAKSKDGSLLEIGFQARFLGHNLNKMSRRYEDGMAFDRPKVTFVGRQDFSKYASISDLCKQDEGKTGLFQGTISTVAQTSTPEGKVSFGLQGLTLTYRAGFKWAQCPDAEGGSPADNT